jgi:hypothetical protein
MVSMKPTARNGMVQFVGKALLICFLGKGKKASRKIDFRLDAPTRVGAWTRVTTTRSEGQGGSTQLLLTSAYPRCTLRTKRSGPSLRMSAGCAPKSKSNFVTGRSCHSGLRRVTVVVPSCLPFSRFVSLRSG